MRYLLTISYDGENFFGWQIQKDKRTVQGEIENALKILFKKQITVTGSGRTDAGVSAYKQKAHFTVDNEILDFSKFLYSLNGILSNDVRVLEIKTTDIHARFNAKEKTYLYKMYISNIDLPLNKKMLRLDKNINLKLMKKCVKKLKGEHDFKNLVCTGSKINSTNRIIYNAKLIKNGDCLNFYITGNGFLYKMVRNIVGLLIEVGKGKVSINEFVDVINAKVSWKNKTAPAESLFLYDVKYKE